MYRTALEQGNPMKYNTLVSSLNNYFPKLLDDDIEYSESHIPYYHQHHMHRVPEVDPHYAYYFYPLETFRHELINPHGYKTLVNFFVKYTY